MYILVCESQSKSLKTMLVLQEFFCQRCAVHETLSNDSNFSDLKDLDGSLYI